MLLWSIRVCLADPEHKKSEDNTAVGAYYCRLLVYALWTTTPDLCSQIIVGVSYCDHLNFFYHFKCNFLHIY